MATKYHRSYIPKDNHLNIFYSYSQKAGKDSASNDEGYDKQTGDIIENNVTRAMLITLMQLNPEHLLFFLKELDNQLPLTLDDFKVNICFNMQGLRSLRDDSSEIDVIKNAKIKRAIVITKEVINILPNRNSAHDNVQSENGKSIPDGWIYSMPYDMKDSNKNSFAILIESKTNSSFNKIQLNNHLKNYFDVEPDDDLIIYTTWDKICESLANTIKRHNTNEVAISSLDAFFTTQFKEYLAMAGQVFDLSKVVKEGFDGSVIKKQIPLVMERINEKMDKCCEHWGNYCLVNAKHERGSRPPIWDYFGKKNEISGEVKKNPHYTVIFHRDSYNIYLTLTKADKKQLSALFDEANTRIFWETIEQILKVNKNNQYRLYIKLSTYRIRAAFGVSTRTGHQKGDSLDSFVLSLRYAECKNLLKPTTGGDVQQFYYFIRHFIANIKDFKQFEFGLIVDYPNSDNSNNPLIMDNAKLFKKGAYFIDFNCDFIRATLPLFDLLAK